MNPAWHIRGGPKAMLCAAGYTSPLFLQLIDRMETVLDPNEEDHLYRELTRLFQEDVPATFLYPDVSTTIASTRVSGLAQSVYRGDLTQCMDALWPEEKA
jgi:ABC-type transport system substrate-binding protein